MASEDTDVTQEEQRWSIDADWLEQNGRSFAALAERCVCSECRKRLKNTEANLSEKELVATVRDCCSTSPGFISGTVPIMESVFRLFLANGNQPLDLIELGRQLSDRRGVDAYRTSVEVLSRLFRHDQYYGIRPTGK